MNDNHLVSLSITRKEVGAEHRTLGIPDHISPADKSTGITSRCLRVLISPVAATKISPRQLLLPGQGQQWGELKRLE